MNIDNQSITLIVVIIINTIASIIGTFKGNKSLVNKAEEKKQKAINKLIKKHNKTEKKYLEEDKKIKELENNGNKQ